MMPCGRHLDVFCCQIEGVKLVRTKDWAASRSLEKSSHEFHAGTEFDHLEGVQSYEPYDAADFIYSVLFLTFPPLF